MKKRKIVFTILMVMCGLMFIRWIARPRKRRVIVQRALPDYPTADIGDVLIPLITVAVLAFALSFTWFVWPELSYTAKATTRWVITNHAQRAAEFEKKSALLADHD